MAALVCSLVGVAAAPVRAEALFVNHITVAGLGSLSQGTHDIRQVANLYEQASLEQLFPGYQGNEEVTSRIVLRGPEVLLRFAANDSDLLIDVPVLGIGFAIRGLPRNLAMRLLDAWLRGDLSIPGAEGGSVTPVLRALIRYSPVDPVAGNPNSLESKMFDADFATATAGPFMKPFSKLDTTPGAKPGAIELPQVRHRFRAEADFSQFKGGPYAGQSYDLGFGYAIRLPHPRLAVLLDLPLAVTQSEGGTSFIGSGGVGLQVNVRPGWNVTPILRIGAAGSFDLGALAVIYGGSLVSSLRFELWGYELGLDNMVGAGSNIDSVKYGNTALAYEITNAVLKNGVSVARPLPWRAFGRPLRARVFYTLTNYLGTELYLPNQHDTGIAVSAGGASGPSRRPGPLSLQLGWTGGSGYDALLLKAIWRF